MLITSLYMAGLQGYQVLKRPDSSFKKKNVSHKTEIGITLLNTSVTVCCDSLLVYVFFPNFISNYW